LSDLYWRHPCRNEANKARCRILLMKCHMLTWINISVSHISKTTYTWPLYSAHTPTLIPLAHVCKKLTAHFLEHYASCHSQSIRPSPLWWIAMTSCYDLPLTALAPDVMHR
jgi:hypothetical protein